MNNPNEQSVGLLPDESLKRKGVVCSDWFCWLMGKIIEAEKALETREDMARTWRSGTDAEWRSAAAMHPSTSGKKSTKADRLKQAASHDRIAAKLRHDLEMLRVIHAVVTMQNTVVRHADDNAPHA